MEFALICIYIKFLSLLWEIGETPDGDEQKEKEEAEEGDGKAKLEEEELAQRLLAAIMTPEKFSDAAAKEEIKPETDAALRAFESFDIADQREDPV